MASPKDEKLKSIPASRFSRAMKLAQLTASVGASTLGNRIAGAFRGAEGRASSELLNRIEQARKLADTLSQMKGAAMKLGQILSLHGEHLFPKEVVEVLARLQASSDQMDFAVLEKVLREELGEKYGRELVGVEREPMAAASIGQVHRGKYAPEALDVAVKIQYPGVDRSIDSDVDSLASIFAVLTRFPAVGSFNSVLEEIKEILRQETDYVSEAEHLEFFRESFAAMPGVRVPRAVREVSTRRVLVTEVVGGLSVQEFAASTASLEARNAIARKYIEVFYTELFELGRVQTDPNFANYKIEWSFGRADPGLILLDFGAVKSFDSAFRESYKKLLRAALRRDAEGVREFSVGAGFLREDDPEELVRMNLFSLVL